MGSGQSVPSTSTTTTSSNHNGSNHSNLIDSNSNSSKSIHSRRTNPNANSNSNKNNLLSVDYSNSTPSRPISARRPVNAAAVFESPMVSPTQERVSRVPRPPVSVTFRWSLGGTNVSVTGSFLDWKTELRMDRAQDGTFSCTQSLEPGTHQYKFIVDGVWRHHPDQPTVHDEVGNINNFVDVVEPTAKQLFPRRPESPPGDYAQIMPEELNPASTANLNPDVNKAMRVPNIPPHLLRALLNTAPSPDDPSTLPLPHHVMVNHLYVLPRATPGMDCTVLGATHMVKNKYITTVLYCRNTNSNQQ